MEECEYNAQKKFLKEGITLDNLKKSQVEVTMLDIDWLLFNKSDFMEFSKNISETKNHKIYQTEFMKTLVD